jgi:hypothetical protein
MTIAMILRLFNQASNNWDHRNSCHRPLFRALTCLLAILAFSAVCGSTAWAQKAGGQQEPSAVSPPRSAAGPIDLDRYFAEGYSIQGPTVLDSVSSQALVFPGRHGLKGLTISLANKSVVVMDAAGNVKSFSALAPGVSVLVCHRSDRVVIYLVSAAKGGPRNAS